MQSFSSVEAQQTQPTDSAALIEVEHLSRVIPTRARHTVILDDVSCAIPTHSLFAIMGHSAAANPPC